MLVVWPPAALIWAIGVLLLIGPAWAIFHFFSRRTAGAAVVLSLIFSLPFAGVIAFNGTLGAVAIAPVIWGAGLSLVCWRIAYRSEPASPQTALPDAARWL